MTNVAHLLHIDRDAERFWEAAHEHSRPDARAGAAVAYLDRVGRPVTVPAVVGIAEVPESVASEFVDWYAAGFLAVPGRTHAVAVGMAAAYDLTDYAMGAAHPGRRRRS